MMSFASVGFLKETLTRGVGSRVRALRTEDPGSAVNVISLVPKVVRDVVKSYV